jgi:transcription elongation factor/antiterminator RfaH
MGTPARQRLLNITRIDGALMMADFTHNCSVSGPRAGDANRVSGIGGLPPPPEFEGEARWFVARTRPFSELRAVGNLERQGHHVFCPRAYKLIRHARKTSRVMRPLFPNYLFIERNVSRDPWRSINSTRGIAGLIMQGDRPQPVPRGVVEALLRHIKPDGTLETSEKFEIGRAVRIEDGPLADIVGKFECCEPDGRIRVLVDLLGRIVSIVLNRETLITAA